MSSVTFFVWGHHMFVNGQRDLASLVFSGLSFAVAVPSAVKVYNWTATIHKGSLRLDTPMLYAMGYIGLFVLGGLTGLYLATLSINACTAARSLQMSVSWRNFCSAGQVLP